MILCCDHAGKNPPRMLGWLQKFLRIVRARRHSLRVDLTHKSGLSPEQSGEQLVNTVLPAYRSRKCSAKPSGPADFVLATSLQDPDVCGRVDWKSIVPVYSRDLHLANKDLEEFHFCRVSPHQRQTIESHIRHCDGCRGALDELREFIELWREMNASAAGFTEISSRAEVEGREVERSSGLKIQASGIERPQHVIQNKSAR
jgi:hypothetical protein